MQHLPYTYYEHYVREQYPNSKCRWNGKFIVDAVTDLGKVEVLGTGETSAEAWESAYEGLEVKADV